ncbi:MAG TPA: gfo/Idh/MocA family oxidoreductase [Planctomycetaceae bacterium]|nr:gfo/Idh/MocA family oxidoreductase [Planctomycetaceae bacterium]
MKIDRTRRQFALQLSSVFAAPYVVSNRVFGKSAPSNKTTVAFIGVGNNGYNWAKRFMADERCQIVAVCDVNREGPGYWNNSVRGALPAQRLVNEHYGGKVCDVHSDYREVLQRDDIDAIYIGTPDHWHAIIAVTAANAKKDIYGQKPLSLTVSEGRWMTKAVEKNGVVWQTGSQQRSDQNFRRACELVRNGRIGKLQRVVCGLPGGTPDFGKTAERTDPEPVPEGFDYDMWLGPAPWAEYCPARVGVNFRWVLDYSGGQITDWGGHHPDIAQWGMDTERTGPSKIRDAQGEFAEGPIYNTATKYRFVCDYDNGVELVVGSSEKSGVTFEGDEGWVWANRGRHDASSKQILDSKIGSEETHLYKSDNHVADFLDCVRTRKQPVAPIEVAHRSISIAHLGNIALRLGRDLNWDPAQEMIVGDESASAMLERPYRQPWDKVWKELIGNI